MKMKRQGGLPMIHQRVSKFFIFSGVLALVLVLTAVPASAQPAGTVTFLAGQATATATDETIRTLALDDPVFSGDVISTDPNSRVRILFADKSVLFLRPSSTMAIVDYSHSGDLERDRSIFKLMKGGFRAVAGSISRTSDENYRVETQVAFIGIRGTDFESRFCADDCYDLKGLGVSVPPDGLYTGTNRGMTVISGLEFGPGQYGYTNPQRVTVRLPEAPPILRFDPFLRGALSDMEPVSPDDMMPDRGPEEAREDQDDTMAALEDADGIDIPAQPTAVSAVPCR